MGFFGFLQNLYGMAAVPFLSANSTMRLIAEAKSKLRIEIANNNNNNISILRWGCEAPLYLRWGTHPTSCVWKWDSDTCHLHSRLFYLFSSPNIYNVKHSFFHNFFSTSSAVSLQVAVSLEHTAAGMKRRTLWEQANRKKVRPRGKDTKKRTAGLCGECVRNGLEVSRMGKDK